MKKNRKQIKREKKNLRRQNDQRFRREIIKESVRQKSKDLITPLLRSTSDFPDTPMEMGIEVNGKNEWIQDGVDYRERLFGSYQETLKEGNRFQNNWERFFSYYQNVFNKTREELIEEKITSMGLNDTISELVESLGGIKDKIFDPDEQETPREFVLKLSLMTDREWSRVFNIMVEKSL